MKLRLPGFTPMGWLRLASVMALVGLAFMMWSLFDPRPPPVLIALSVGQGIGTLSLAIFLGVILADYRARHRADPPESVGSEANPLHPVAGAGVAAAPGGAAEGGAGGGA